MAESKLHKPTPLEELLQQSLPSEAAHPYSRPVRYSPSTRTVGGPVTPSPGGAPSQETRTDIGAEAAQENISRQITPSPQSRDEIRPGPEIPGAMRPSTREELLGPGEFVPTAPKEEPQIERRFSGQETISTQEAEEQLRIQEMGRKQYETPLRHSLLLSEAIVGKPEEHRDPAAQVISTGVEFVITLPAHTLMAPVELPRTAIATGQAIQEKGFVPWSQESIKYVMEKPGVRVTQLVLVAGTMLLPIGAKFLRGRALRGQAKYSVKARAIETDLLIERGGDWVTGRAKTDIIYSTGETSTVYTRAISRRTPKGLIDTRSTSIAAGKDSVSHIRSRSFIKEGDLRPFRSVSAELTVSKAAGGKVLKGKLIESGGIQKDVVVPDLESSIGATRLTPSRGKPTGTIEAGLTKTVIEIDAGKMVYKKQIGGEIIKDISLKDVPMAPTPDKVIRPGTRISSGKRITTETIGKTSLDIHTESAMSRQIDQVSKIRPRTTVSQTRTAPGPVATTAGPESPLEIRGYPGPEVRLAGPSRSGFDQLGVIRQRPGDSGSGRITKMDQGLGVIGAFRVRTLTGQAAMQGQRLDQSQVMAEVSATDQIVRPRLGEAMAQASAQAIGTKMLQGFRADLFLKPPRPTGPLRTGRGGLGPPFIVFMDTRTGKVDSFRVSSRIGKGFGYQPTLGGLLSGKTISTIPAGAFTGMERRYPVKRKKKKK